MFLVGLWITSTFWLCVVAVVIDRWAYKRAKKSVTLLVDNEKFTGTPEDLARIMKQILRDLA